MAYGTINVPGMSGSDLEAVRKLLEEASPFLIQEEEPPGNEKKTWIQPSTHLQHYYDGTAWVPLAVVWG